MPSLNTINMRLFLQSLYIGLFLFPQLVSFTPCYKPGVLIKGFVIFWPVMETEPHWELLYSPTATWQRSGSLLDAGKPALCPKGPSHVENTRHHSAVQREWGYTAPQEVRVCGCSPSLLVILHYFPLCWVQVPSLTFSHQCKEESLTSCCSSVCKGTLQKATSEPMFSFLPMWNWYESIWIDESMWGQALQKALLSSGFCQWLAHHTTKSTEQGTGGPSRWNPCVRATHGSAFGWTERSFSPCLHLLYLQMLLVHARIYSYRAARTKLVTLGPWWQEQRRWAIRLLGRFLCGVCIATELHQLF